MFFIILSSVYTVLAAMNLAWGSGTTELIALEEISRTAGCHYAAADYDLDGRDEMAVLDCDMGRMSLYDADRGIFLPVWHQPIFKGRFCRIDAHDIIGDKAPEIFVSVKRGDSTWVQVYSEKGELLKETTPITGIDRQNDGTWDGFVQTTGMCDVSGDGQKDILLAVNTRYDLYPRGIYAYEWERGNLMWHFPSASAPYRLITTNLDQNMGDEILFSTNAPSNGNVNIMNGMDDSHSYIVALGRSGNLLWMQQTSGKFFVPCIEIRNLSQTAQTEVINTYAGGDPEDPQTRFELQIRDVQSGSVKRYFPLPSTSPGFILADLNRDDEPEIICGSDDGTLTVFDKELHLLNKTKNESSLKPITVRDLNGDGDSEIIALSGFGLRIFNSGLQSLGQYRSDGPIRHAQYLENPFQQGYFLTCEGTEDEAYLVLHTFKISKKPLMPVAGWGATSLYAIAILLIGALIGILLWELNSSLRTKLKELWLRKSGISQRREALLEALSVFGHGKLPTSNLDRIALLFKNVPGNENMYETYYEKLKETIDTYEGYTSEHLCKIETCARDAKMSRRHIKALQGDIQHMKKMISGLRKHNYGLSKIQHIAQDTTALSKRLEIDVKRIEAELSTSFNSDVIATTQKVLTAAKEATEKNRVDFKGLNIHHPGVCRGFIREDELTAIMEDLVSNSISAMSGSARKELGIEIINDKSKIYVNTTDSGCGIREEDIQKIFDRNFSSREGGGFGLYYAKTTLAKYGGKIRVLETEVGKGTTMQIELRSRDSFYASL